ncbi:putative disease resistance protein [Sesbania bispinosa]|nr:putative disease resistance protein [Sesbania bispinosa]
MAKDLLIVVEQDSESEDTQGFLALRFPKPDGMDPLIVLLLISINVRIGVASKSGRGPVKLFCLRITLLRVVHLPTSGALSSPEAVPQKGYYIHKEILKALNLPNAKWEFHHSIDWKTIQGPVVDSVFPVHLESLPQVGRYRIESLVSRPKEDGILPTKLQFTAANCDKTTTIPKPEGRPPLNTLNERSKSLNSYNCQNPMECSQWMRELSQTTGYTEDTRMESGISPLSSKLLERLIYLSFCKFFKASVRLRETTWWAWSHSTPSQEHGVESEAFQVEFMEGGTNVQCLMSDKRVTPSEVECRNSMEEDREKRSFQIIPMKKRRNRTQLKCLRETENKRPYLGCRLDYKHQEEARPQWKGGVWLLGLREESRKVEDKNINVRNCCLFIGLVN